MENETGNWFDVGPSEICPLGSAVEVVAGGQIIALFHVDGQFWALQGTCPHHGGPLGKGQLDGCVVTCPWHGWQFDVRDGSYQHSRQMSHPTFPVKVDEGRVWIQVATA